MHHDIYRFPVKISRSEETNSSSWNLYSWSLSQLIIINNKFYFFANHPSPIPPLKLPFCWCEDKYHNIQWRQTRHAAGSLCWWIACDMCESQHPVQKGCEQESEKGWDICNVNYFTIIITEYIYLPCPHWPNPFRHSKSHRIRIPLVQFEVAILPWGEIGDEMDEMKGSWRIEFQKILSSLHFAKSLVSLESLLENKSLLNTHSSTIESLNSSPNCRAMTQCGRPIPAKIFTVFMEHFQYFLGLMRVPCFLDFSPSRLSLFFWWISHAGGKHGSWLIELILGASKSGMRVNISVGSEAWGITSWEKRIFRGKFRLTFYLNIGFISVVDAVFGDDDCRNEYRLQCLIDESRRRFPLARPFPLLIPHNQTAEVISDGGHREGFLDDYVEVFIIVHIFDIWCVDEITKLSRLGNRWLTSAPKIVFEPVQRIDGIYLVLVCWKDSAYCWIVV